jgi:hypothetical protein
VAGSSGMSAHDWITVAGLIIGSGGGWRLLGKLERFLVKVDRLITRVDKIEATTADLASSHRQVVKQQAKLVDRVNDHEAQLRRW